MVEDSEVMRGVLLRVISDGGYDILAVEDPAAARETSSGSLRSACS